MTTCIICESNEGEECGGCGEPICELCRSTVKQPSGTHFPEEHLEEDFEPFPEDDS